MGSSSREKLDSSREEGDSSSPSSSPSESPGCPPRHHDPPATGDNKKGGSKVGLRTKKKRLARWRGVATQAMKKNAAAAALTNAKTNSRSSGFSRDGDSDGRDVCRSAGVSGRDDSSCCDGHGAGGDEATMVTPPKKSGQEGCGTVVLVFAELERLKAVSKAPAMLTARCPLHQELGVTILKRGLEGFESNTGRPATR